MVIYQVSICECLHHRLVDRNGVTAAVDPVEPSKLIEAAKKEGLQISSVLTTHHHWCDL